MLVAGASLSLLAPIAAQASDVVNIEEMNSYSRSSKSSKKQIDSSTFSNEIANANERVDVLESRLNEFEAGGFSDTTVLDGKAIFDVGSVDTDDDTYTGETQFMYTYTMNLNTSFTGDDNLYTRLKTGNHTSWSKTKSVYNTYLSSGNGNDNTLKVDKLWYTTPIGDTNHTVTFGPKIENYYMHATTPSIYEPVLKAFTLGGNGAGYGASTSPGAGWAYTADNGFAVSSNITSKNPVFADTKQSWATQIGYTKSNYSVSALVNMKYNGWTDSYFQSADGKARPGDGNSTNVGLRAWWRPTDSSTAMPSISVGYDTSETDASSNSNTTAYFVGLNWTDTINPDDKIGIAFGQPQKVEGETVDPFLYEIYYKYKVNDSISVTPTIFGGTSKNSSDVEADMTGYLLQTTFKF